MNAAVSIPATTTPASAWVLSTDGQSLTVSAQLDNAEAVDKLIRVLEANKLLLPARAKREHQEPALENLEDLVGRITPQNRHAPT